jgi:hypothetical protein
MCLLEFIWKGTFLSQVERIKQNLLQNMWGARSNVVGWGIMLQTEGRGFDFRWGHWIFHFTYSFQPHYVPGVDSASNRNEYQEST